MTRMARFVFALVALLAAACTPAAEPAKPAAPAKAATTPAAAPGPAPLPPEEREARALARDLDIDRLVRAVQPFRRAGALGLVYLDGAAPAAAPKEVGAAWASMAERLRGRLGDLRPLTPLAIELATTPESAPAGLLDRVRRAGAQQGLEYVLIYRIASTAPTGGGVFGAKGSAQAEAEAVLLDVRTGAILGGATAQAAGAKDAPIPDEAAARAGAVTALGAELETLARRLDSEAMRAAIAPS